MVRESKPIKIDGGECNMTDAQAHPADCSLTDDRISSPVSFSNFHAFCGLSPLLGNRSFGAQPACDVYQECRS
eukprot:164286-Rhodomonas_salina.4